MEGEEFGEQKVRWGCRMWNTGVNKEDYRCGEAFWRENNLKGLKKVCGRRARWNAKKVGGREKLGVEES